VPLASGVFAIRTQTLDQSSFGGSDAPPQEGGFYYQVVAKGETRRKTWGVGGETNIRHGDNTLNIFFA
jgi:hypothetical protein